LKKMGVHVFPCSFHPSFPFFSIFSSAYIQFCRKRNYLRLMGLVVYHGLPQILKEVPVPLSVRAVERALDILLSFNGEEPTRSLTQIAESVHLSKPTVHRLLATLEKKRFIAKDMSSGRYRLDDPLHEGAKSPITSPSIQHQARLQNCDSERSVIVDFPAASIPASIRKDPQTSNRFNRAGSHQVHAGA
jgi:hypothetical protein